MKYDGDTASKKLPRLELGSQDSYLSQSLPGRKETISTEETKRLAQEANQPGTKARL